MAGEPLDYCQVLRLMIGKQNRYLSTVGPVERFNDGLVSESFNRVINSANQWTD